MCTIRVCQTFLFPRFTVYSLIRCTWILGHMLFITVFNPCSIHEEVISCKSFDPSCPLLLLHCVFSDLQKTWSRCTSPVHMGTMPATEEDTIHENLISWSKSHFLLFFSGITPIMRKKMKLLWGIDEAWHSFTNWAACSDSLLCFI